MIGQAVALGQAAAGFDIGWGIRYAACAQRGHRMATGLAIKQPFDRSDFLVWEAAQPDRWELVGGIIRLMPGGRVDHNLVAGNVFAFLHARLRGGPCLVFQQNMKLTPAENEDSTYPDVLVTCRPLAGDSPSVETATVIVEVLPPGTRAYDAEEKWAGYRRIDDLRHYALVDPTRLHVELFSRADPGEEWRYRVVDDLESELPLPAIGVEIPLREIHAGTASERR
jgi:Uma2 family endonuclease